MYIIPTVLRRALLEINLLSHIVLSGRKLISSEPNHKKKIYPGSTFINSSIPNQTTWLLIDLYLINQISVPYMGIGFKSNKPEPKQHSVDFDPDISII